MKERPRLFEREPRLTRTHIVALFYLIKCQLIKQEHIYLLVSNHCAVVRMVFSPGVDGVLQIWPCYKCRSRLTLPSLSLHVVWIKVLSKCLTCKLYIFSPRSLELSPFNVKSLLRRAAAYEALERYRLAYVDYKTALQIDCNITAAHDGTNR